MAVLKYARLTPAGGLGFDIDSGGSIFLGTRIGMRSTRKSPLTSLLLLLPGCERTGLPIAILWCAIGFTMAASGAEQTSQSGGSSNRVLILDGKTGGMRVPDSSALHSLTNAITLEVWFKAVAFYPEDGSVNSLIRKNVAEGAENFFLRFRTIEGKPWIEMSPGNQVGVLRASYEFATNRWYHLAGTYNGSEAAVLVNGTKLKSERFSGSMAIDDSDLFIGKGDPKWSSGEFFHGAVDEIRIWSLARSPEQIQGTMKGNLTGKEVGLIAYWNFDLGKPNDLSGHGNDGGLVGDAQIVQSAKAE